MALGGPRRSWGEVVRVCAGRRGPQSDQAARLEVRSRAPGAQLWSFAVAMPYPSVQPPAAFCLRLGSSLEISWTFIEFTRISTRIFL